MHEPPLPALLPAACAFALLSCPPFGCCHRPHPLPTPAAQSYEDYLEPVLARLDCLRRRGADALPTLRDTFAKASQLLQSYFPDQLDRTFRQGRGPAGLPVFLGCLAQRRARGGRPRLPACQPAGGGTRLRSCPSTCPIPLDGPCREPFSAATQGGTMRAA